MVEFSKIFHVPSRVRYCWAFFCTYYFSKDRIDVCYYLCPLDLTFISYCYLKLNKGKKPKLGAQTRLERFALLLTWNKKCAIFRYAIYICGNITYTKVNLGSGGKNTLFSRRTKIVTKVEEQRNNKKRVTRERRVTPVVI